MTQDLNDHAKEGTLPKNLRKESRPITAEAKDYAEIESVVHHEDEALRASAERTFSTDRKSSKCITVGHYEVDENTGGLEKGFVWFIGADTSWGKSSHAIMVREDNLPSGTRTLIVSAEDSADLYADRVLCRRAMIEPKRYKHHRKGWLTLSSEELGRIQSAVNSATHTPMVLDSRGKSVEMTAKRIRKIVESEGIDVVLVDYIQAMDHDKSLTGRREQVSYIGRVLVDVIKTAGAAGVIYSQITVDPKKQYPDRHSLKESRDLANMGETIALGFIADKEIRSSSGSLIASPGQKALFVDKVKDGVPRRLYAMDWDDNFARFHQVRDPDRKYDDEFEKPFHFNGSI